MEPEVELTSLACKLYEKGIVSLERAAITAGLSTEVMKEALYARGISRQAPEDLAETVDMAREALTAARRAGPP